jgi:toxin ParE1/3/4
MAGFRLLRRARADLLEIGAFTADRWGDAQAERYLIGLFAGFQTLVDRPDLRRPFREIPPYLRALIGKHAAFYRVIPDGEVLIVRVLHAAMLPALHLSDANDEDDE